MVETDIGVIIDERYDVLEPLGSGGIGTVYRARDLKEGRDVGLKILNHSVDREEVRRRFRREFHVLSRIRHPRIVRTHRWGLYKGSPYFSMDYLPGRTLAQVMADEAAQASLRGQWLFPLVRQVGEGLACIHGQGMVHRDLKPSNIMVCETDDEDGIAATILDLGLARFREAGRGSLTLPGVVMGTVEYMAPEQGKGGWVDQRSDLYALGIILYEILAGTPPFTGESPVAVILKHIRELPQLPPTLNSGIDTQLREVVLKLLEKEPIDRYQSAVDMLETMRKIEPGSSPVSTEEPAPVAVSHRTLRPHLLGREKEMKVLRGLLDEAGEGKRRTVLVSGEAGIGKTRLMEELQGDAAVYGLRILRGACYQEGGRAYGPLVEAVGSDLLEQREETDRHEAIEKLSDFLKELSRVQPTLLCIEDIQWADELTVQFLQFLQRDPDEVPLMLCLSCRRTGNEPVPERLENLFHGRRMRELVHLHLGRLPISETGYLAASMLGEREVPKEAARVLYEETGGHPLFVVEMVRALVEAGVIQHDEIGGWRWRPIPRTLMPAGVMEALQRRIETVTPEQRRVLEYTAVLRGGFSFELLSGMWQGDELNLLETLEDLVGLGVLWNEESPDERYRFSHVLFQRAIYEGLQRQKRLLLHREAGRALETLYGDDHSDVIDDLAYHFSKSGDREMAYYYLREAGKQALTAQAFLLAVEWFEEALKQKESQEEGLDRSLEEMTQDMDFLCDYAQVLHYCSRNDKAITLIEKILGFVSDDMPAQKARALLLRGSICGFLRRGEEAEKSLLSALAIYWKLGDDKGELGALNRLGNSYDSMRRVEDAVAYHHLAAEKCLRFDGPIYEIMALIYQGQAALVKSQFQEACPYFESAFEKTEQTKDRRCRHNCLFYLNRISFYMGEFDRAVEMLYELRVAGQKWGVVRSEADTLFLLGEIALERGDVGGAELYAKEAEGLLSEIEDRYHLCRVYALLAAVKAEAGEAGQALKWAERARSNIEVEGEMRTASIPLIWCRIAQALSSAGRFQEAEETFDRAVESRRSLKGAQWTLSVLGAGEFHLERGNLKVAREHLETALQECEKMGATYFAQKASDLLRKIPEQVQEGVSVSALAATLSQDRLATLCKVSEDLTALLDLDPLLDRIFDRLQAVSRAERAIVALKDESPGAFHIEVARSHNLQDAAVEAISRGVIRDVIEQNEPILSLDARSDERFRGYQSVIDYGIRSVLCVPLYHAEVGVIGALYVDHRGLEKVFSEADRMFLSAFGNLVSIAVVNARMYTRAKEQALYLQEQVEGRHRLGDLVGKSQAMQWVYRLIERAADTDVTVLIQGETGTGKELAAQAIHYNGHRKDRPFLSQNCAAFSPELLHSELFGHKKGAFTGSVADRVGLFEAADGGTVFLDEIADASDRVQSSLLRVLQEGEIRRVGESRDRKVDVRVIAATNRDLELEVEKGNFREDLYYRLRVLPIEMPPLRERVEDIPLLAEDLLRGAAEATEKSVGGFTVGAIQALMDHRWPGNVRELENEIQRAVAVAEEGREITADLFSDRVGTGAEDTREPLKARLEAVEKQAIADMLVQCDGNVTRTASRLGISRRGLYKKIARYGLKGDS